MIPIYLACIFTLLFTLYICYAEHSTQIRCFSNSVTRYGVRKTILHSLESIAVFLLQKNSGTAAVSGDAILESASPKCLVERKSIMFILVILYLGFRIAKVSLHLIINQQATK